MRRGIRRHSAMAAAMIDRTSGTNIGSMTAAGGLAAAFDGVTVQNATACCSTPSGTSGYVGKTLASASKIDHAVVYSASDAGFVSSANPEVTLELYAKTGAAPASATDGTLLGTHTMTDVQQTNIVELTSSDKATAFAHVWVHISTPASSAFKRIAEIEFWGIA